MFRVYLPNLSRWIENIPPIEALVYKEEGYLVERMTCAYVRHQGRDI